MHSDGNENLRLGEDYSLVENKNKNGVLEEERWKIGGSI